MLGLTHAEQFPQARAGSPLVDWGDAVAAWNLRTRDEQVGAQLLRFRSGFRKHNAG